MTLYMVLFLSGFILAIGLLAYTSTQVTELSKKAEIFNTGLVERYSKPLKELVDLDKKSDKKSEKKLDDKPENKTESKTESKA